MKTRVCTKQEHEQFVKKEHSTGILPFQFYKELLQVLQLFPAEFLTANDCHVKIEYENITPESFKRDLKQEHKEWLKTRKHDTTYFLLLHDCDSAPFASVKMLELEKEMGVVSTLALTPRWPHFNQDDTCLFPLDFNALRSLQAEGFAFSYHCNAAQLCYGDEKEVFALYDEDVDYLRKQGLDIQWYAAHGGPRNRMNKLNNEYFYPAFVKNTMPSTHNMYALSAGAYYSDGNFKPDCDIRVFLQKKANLGIKHRILIHPCYYTASDTTGAQKNFESHPFVKEYWDLYSANKTEEYWHTTIENILSKKSSTTDSKAFKAYCLL